MLLVRNATLLSDVDRATLLRILVGVNLEWTTPNAYIPRNRPPTSFHVVLQCTSEDARLFQSLLASSDLSLATL